MKTSVVYARSTQRAKHGNETCGSHLSCGTVAAIVCFVFCLGCDSTTSTEQAGTRSPDASGLAAKGPSSDLGVGDPKTSEVSGRSQVAGETNLPTLSNADAPVSNGGEANKTSAAAPSNGPSNSLIIEPTLSTTGAGTPDVRAQTASLQVPPDMADRSFMKLKDPAAEPQAIIQFFGEVDRAMQELALTMRGQQLSEQQWTQVARKISSQKLAAAQKLAQIAGSDMALQKKAIAAEVESLSHLTGLGDVEAARTLQARAAQLADSSDPALAHQGRLVLLGFRMNQLQEGQVKDPKDLLAEINLLFQRPEDRGVVELMALQQCAGVLSQLGYKDESKQVIDRIGKEFRDSSDPKLSMAAWQIETAGAPSLASLNEVAKAIFDGVEKDQSRIGPAALQVWAEFPSASTLQMLASNLVNLEFNGRLAAAAELARVIDGKLSQVPAPIRAELSSVVASHQARFSLIGQPLELEGIVPFDGMPFDWASYRGKVTVVTFWASWCINCLQEFPELRQLYAELGPSGLEVVAINMDDQLANASERIARDRFPWRNFRSSDEKALGFDSLVAKRLGVTAIPFVVIVDRSGRVSQIHQRGASLRPAVEKLMAEGAPTR